MTAVFLVALHYMLCVSDNSYMSSRGPVMSEAAQSALADNACSIGYRASQLVFAWEWGTWYLSTLPR
jgi:hypothetical protein